MRISRNRISGTYRLAFVATRRFWSAASMPSGFLRRCGRGLAFCFQRRDVPYATIWQAKAAIDRHRYRRQPGDRTRALPGACLEAFPFLSYSEQERAKKGNIAKRHFKFEYPSPVFKRPQRILLDVLFEGNQYAELCRKEIKCDLLITEGEPVYVRMPTSNCILGDKLTAFAPHTTGIPLRVG